MDSVNLERSVREYGNDMVSRQPEGSPALDAQRCGVLCTAGMLAEARRLSNRIRIFCKALFTIDFTNR